MKLLSLLLLSSLQLTIIGYDDIFKDYAINIGLFKLNGFMLI